MTPGYKLTKGRQLGDVQVNGREWKGTKGNGTKPCPAKRQTIPSGTKSPLSGTVPSTQGGKGSSY